MNEKQVQEEFLTKFFHALQAGLDGLQTVRAAYDKRIAFSFSAMNFFDPDENKISEILAFFLNPTKFHGQKEVFLKVFLEAFCLTDALGLLATQMPIVERETRIDGDRRIDITIRFKSEYLIGIENKIGAADQPMQLFDYHKWLEKESNDRYTLFYLTRDGRNASSGSIDEKVAAKLTTSGKLQCVSYANHIIRLFEDFEKVCAADNVRAFIRDFTQYLKQRYIGEKIMGEIEFIEQTIRKYPEILTHVDGIARIKNKLMDENCKNFFGGLIAKLRSTGIQTKDFASDREFPSFRIFGTSRGQIFSNLPNMFIRVEGYRSRGILSVGVSTHECKDVAMPRWSEFEQLNRTLRTKFPNHDNCARPSLNVCWPTGTLVLLKPWFDNAEYLANLLKIRSQLDIDVDAAFHQIVGYVSLVQDAWNTVKITESPEMSESTI